MLQPGIIIYTRGDTFALTRDETVFPIHGPPL